jgi:hypothetical protein
MSEGHRHRKSTHHHHDDGTHHHHDDAGGGAPSPPPADVEAQDDEAKEKKKKKRKTKSGPPAAPPVDKTKMNVAQKNALKVGLYATLLHMRTSTLQLGLLWHVEIESTLKLLSIGGDQSGVLHQAVHNARVALLTLRRRLPRFWFLRDLQPTSLRCRLPRG